MRRVRLRRADGEPAVVARRDLAVGLALAASWFSMWGLYAAYTWTAGPGLSSLQAVRFYLPAIGAIALLGAWLLVRVPRRASLAALTSAAVVVAMFGLGVWSYNDMRASWLGEIARIVHGRHEPFRVTPGGRGGPPRAPGSAAATGSSTPTRGDSVEALGPLVQVQGRHQLGVGHHSICRPDPMTDDGVCH